MTDPSTPAGRALLAAHEQHPVWSQRGALCQLIRAIEAEARAEGRREAVREIRLLLAAAEDALSGMRDEQGRCLDCGGTPDEGHDDPDCAMSGLQDATGTIYALDAVAGLNASEPHEGGPLCIDCAKPFQHLGDASEPPPDNWPKPLPAEEHRR